MTADMIFRMATFGLLIKGYLIGAANIIPGVSGGTMALALGIYRRFVTALHALDMDLARAALRCLTFRREARQAFLTALKRADTGFLALLALGAGAAVFSLSRLITGLLHNQFAATYAFFFGLILTSLIFPFRIVQRRGMMQGLACLTAAALTIGITAASSGDAALEKAQRKAELRAQTHATESDAPRIGPLALSRPTPRESVALFCGGALAIAAMILPGISGSFVLLLTGLYFDVLRAVNQRELLALTVFAIGGISGGIGLARLLNRLLKRWRDTTMSFMIGLMIGSLWGLWPFRRVEWVDGDLVIMDHLAPAGWGPALLALACATSAAALVLTADKLGRRHMNGV